MLASSWFQLALGLAVAGCGGNVVVDGPPSSTSGSSGPGGAGGAGATSGSAAGGSFGVSTTASGGAVSCPNQMCGGGSDGSCQCEGSCSDGHSRSVTCTPIPPEASCVCAQDQVVVGKCDTAPDLPVTCDLVASCCGGFFF